MKIFTARIVIAIALAIALPLKSFGSDLTSSSTKNYLDLLGKSFSKAYFPARGYETNPAKIVFSVDKDGNPIDIKFRLRPTYYNSRRTSQLADRCMVYAATNLIPIPRPPKDWNYKNRILVSYMYQKEATARIESTVNSKDSELPTCFLNSGEIINSNENIVEFSLDWQLHMQRFKSIYEFNKNEERYTELFSAIGAPSPQFKKNFVTQKNRKMLSRILQKEKPKKTLSLN
ncbi:MAG: hypothetical protein KIT34_16635 [Cyanobacteria bacterium TGS_CYA1]|nr:hypothetical protein [Cyanobacteria bacterium TGS_CYA1]